MSVFKRLEVVGQERDGRASERMKVDSQKLMETERFESSSQRLLHVDGNDHRPKLNGYEGRKRNLHDHRVLLAKDTP